MPYLSDTEKQTMEWLKGLSTEAYWQSARLDPLGSLVAVLAADASEEVRAWLNYIVAQAPGRGAVVNDYLPEHGTLVLVLPRYAKIEQPTLELSDAETKGRSQGRRIGQGHEEGEDSGTSEHGGQGELGKEEGKAAPAV